ncbi:PorT family protein, partial [Aquimarina celericrescens]|nr:PorT family protein [Aquimarina celericrescens]
AVGLGYEFKNGLTIEARYKQGTLDVFSGDFHDFSKEQLLYEEKNQFNEVFQLGLSYRFNF